MLTDGAVRPLAEAGASPRTNTTIERAKVARMLKGPKSRECWSKISPAKGGWLRPIGPRGSPTRKLFPRYDGHFAKSLAGGDGMLLRRAART